MTDPSALLTADRDRQFADWGVAVILRQVTQTYDPQTQLVSEQTTDTEITAVVGSAPSHPTPHTAARHQSHELHLMLKAEDLTGSTATCRIVHEEAEYHILTATRSANDLTVHLHCRKVG